VSEEVLMPRIVGVDIPKGKRIDVSLRYIYGIGPTTALEVLKAANIDPSRRAKDLTDEEVGRIAAIISRDYRVEGDLRREVMQNVKRLIGISCYKGSRHKKGLPVRGQRTRTNARTRKGPRKTVGVQRKASMAKGGETKE
jgi:small subunit ribosomal protein S13